LIFSKVRRLFFLILKYFDGARFVVGSTTGGNSSPKRLRIGYGGHGRWEIGSPIFLSVFHHIPTSIMQRPAKVPPIMSRQDLVRSSFIIIIFISDKRE